MRLKHCSILIKNRCTGLKLMLEKLLFSPLFWPKIKSSFLMRGPHDPCIHTTISYNRQLENYIPRFIIQTILNLYNTTFCFFPGTSSSATATSAKTAIASTSTSANKEPVAGGSGTNKRKMDTDVGGGSGLKKGLWMGTGIELNESDLESSSDEEEEIQDKKN